MSGDLLLVDIGQGTKLAVPSVDLLYQQEYGDVVAVRNEVALCLSHYLDLVSQHDDAEVLRRVGLIKAALLARK